MSTKKTKEEIEMEKAFNEAFVNVTPDGKVRKLIIQEGDGPFPKLDQDVAIHYNVSLEDGKVVGDSFESKKPLKLKVGGETSIRGIELAVPGMRFGEKVRLDVDPEYGYGSRDNPYGFHGYGERIPPNSKLIIELHLLPYEMAGAKTTKQWLEQAEINKVEGNKAFLAKNDETAKTEYENAIKIIESVKKQLAISPNVTGKSEEETKKILDERNENEINFKNLFIALHSNMAALMLRMRNFDEAKSHCILALEKDPNNTKVLFRLAQAHKEMEQLESAIEVLKKAKNISETKEISAELKKCMQLHQEKLQREKESYSGMFNKLKDKGLYEGVKPAPQPRWKCHRCDEEMDDIQKHRHIIKMHSGQKKEKWSNKEMGLPDQIPLNLKVT